MDHLIQEVQQLKRRQGAIILAHNYQNPEVQAVADFVGDSFELSRKAASVAEKIIVFCGVHFMAESASILAPEKLVLLPEPMAGCPLADTITAEELRAAKDRYPDAAVVCYVNSAAEVKAESDICCTSANALQVVESVPAKRVLFVPDQNLANYVSRFSTKEIIPWSGYCSTHHRVTRQQVEEVRKAKPGVPIAVHPECQPEVVDLADYVGGTSGIASFAKQTAHREIIVGTEMGMLTRLQKENPGKKFYLLSPSLVCPNMKMTSLEKVHRALLNLETRISVPEPVASRARKALANMLAVTKDRSGTHEERVPG